MAPNHKIVVFRLDGNLEQDGFKVELEVGLKGQPLISSFRGNLPPMPMLVQQFKQWQSDYRGWGIPNRIRPKEVVFTGKANNSDACRTSAKYVSYYFNQWQQSPEFLKLDVRLRELVNREEAVTLVLRTESEVLTKLPWHLWEFVDRYPLVEVVIEAKQHDIHSSSLENQSQAVKILSILGDATGIDIETDRAVLDRLPNAEVTFLVSPQRTEINHQLWEQSWDILFFAGHSQTEEKQGRIYINSSDSLTLDELRYGLRQSIKNGLKLAIFNSCDGLGLVHELEDLSLPHLIVMREPVPDQVAQTFLKQFLRVLAQGRPLPQSIRQAREQLQGIEQEFPCASWLPIMYQHPHVDEFLWAQPIQEKSLQGKSVSRKSTLEKTIQEKNNQYVDLSTLEPEILLDANTSLVTSSSLLDLLGKSKKTGLFLISSVLITGLVIGMRWFGLLQQLELQAYDQFIRWQPDNLSLRDRVLIIGIDEADIQYQDSQSMDRQGSLSETALQELLEKITPHQPQLVGLDIIHDYPFSQGMTDILTNQGFVGICQSSSRTIEMSGIKPPDNFDINNIGFNNVPLDQDGTVRRQILGKQSDDICPVNESFSFKLAQIYLNKIAEVKIEWLADSSNQSRKIQLGQQVFTRLNFSSGSYQFPKEGPGGYQIMVNYYPVEPNVIHLRDVLSGSMDTQLQSLVANRIILVGVVDRDRHATPYSPKIDPVPGVIIHAHMMNQVIDAALGDRKIIAWWPEWLENLWIWGWTLIGVGTALVWRSRLSMLLTFGISMGILWGVCFILFIQSLWVPLIPCLLSFGMSSLCVKYLMIEPQKSDNHPINKKARATKEL